jgi:hypothetical protein
MSFDVLVSILQDDAQGLRASSLGCLHLVPLMDEKDIHRQIYSEKDHSTSTFNHDNIQLGGGAFPMYLAKYYFPFVLLSLSFLYVIKKDA